MKDDRSYLLHIADAIKQIRSYTSGGHAAFLKDRLTQDAVLRNLSIVGEAAKKLSKGTREKAPGIPWKSISGMRDKMVHDYFGVDLEIVWSTVEVELPKLKAAVDSLLKGSQ